MNLNKITKQSELICLVGLPGSGKSTWINNFLKNKTEEYVIISSDNILEKIAQACGLTYSDVYNDHINNATSRMNVDAADAISNRQNIIWDQTNLTQGKRKSILNRFPKTYYKRAIVFSVEDEELHKRLNTREKATGKKIPSHVIKNMRESYQEPTKEEGFDEILRI